MRTQAASRCSLYRNRSPVILSALLCLPILLSPATGTAGYGYGEREDPLLKGFPAVIAHGRDGDWKAVGKDLDGLAALVAEVKQKRGKDLAPAISRAAVDRDLPSLAGRLALLTAEAIRIKLQSNLDEGFKSQGAARDRVKAAQSYYDRLLSGNVKKKSEKAHREIAAGFQDAFRAVGSAGFLGAGGTPPDGKAYRKAMTTVSNTLGEVFGK